MEKTHTSKNWGVTEDGVRVIRARIIGTDRCYFSAWVPLECGALGGAFYDHHV